MIQFTVTGRPLPQPRPRVTSRGTFMPSAYAEYRQHVAETAQIAALELEQNGTPWNAHADSYRVRLKFHMPDRRGTDLDKLEATALDALERAGIYRSDRLVDSIRSDRFVDRKAPRLEVCVEVLG
jgi:Holliday junction resolvase RusA-like endonuclease